MTGEPTTQAVKPPKDRRAKQRRTLILWVVTVIVATLGIVLIAAVGPILRGQQKPQIQTATITPRQASEALRAQAQAALTAGDPAGALSIARNAVAVDPTNSAAGDLVSRLSKNQQTNSGSTGSSGSGGKPATGTATPSTAAADVGYLKAVGNLASLLPTGFAAYTLEPAVITPSSVSVSASPLKAGASSGRLIWTVRDVKNVKSAQTFIRKTTKVLYAKDHANVTVHGVSAYYGSDGGRVATVTYARGRYVFELLLPAEMGSGTGTQAAASFGDTPLQ